MTTKNRNTFALLLLMAVLGSYSYVSAEIPGGEWVKKEQRIQGSWAIENREDGNYLVLDENFKTRKAPDLKLVLSKQEIGEVNSRNAMSGAKIVALLKSPKGEQSYKLPADYADYTTLLLHCEKYSKLWGAASI